jgi:endothelin-converting enzyme
MERLLFTLFEEMEEEHGQTSVLQDINPLLSHTWPPWPWPPWGGDGEDDKKKPPTNKTHLARKLAQEVLEFENKIAKASPNRR